MLVCTADDAQGPVATSSPELLLAVLALLDHPQRPTERDLIEALTLSLDDERAATAGTTAVLDDALTRCLCCDPMSLAAG